MEYRQRVAAREEARKKLNGDLEALEAVLRAMEEDSKVKGIDELRMDFEAVKMFIFEAVAGSRGLDIHIELEDEEEPLLSRKPHLPTPPQSALGHCSIASDNAWHDTQRI